MYTTGCRAHFCHLPGLGQVGHSPRGTSGSAGTLHWNPIWLDSIPAATPNPPTPLTVPNAPMMPQTLPVGVLGSNVVGLSVHLPLQCSLHLLLTLNTPYTPCQPPDAPYSPAGTQCPLTPPNPLLAPESLHSLPVPQCTPDYPYTPADPYAP